MKEKFFSVIIPNYNNSTYLEKCLKSVLNQTFTNYELIVIDDVMISNENYKININMILNNIICNIIFD